MNVYPVTLSVSVLHDHAVCILQPSGLTQIQPDRQLVLMCYKLISWVDSFAISYVTGHMFMENYLPDYVTINPENTSPNIIKTARQGIIFQLYRPTSFIN